MAYAKGTMTRARVLDRAIALINRKGVGNTSIQDIIDNTGVKKGNLYFHFSSKDELGLSIIMEARDRYFEYLSKSVTSPDPLGKINDVLRAVLEYHRGRGFIGGCIFGNTALEMADSGEEYADLVRDIFDRWTNILAGFIREAKKRGDLPSAVRPASLARHIVAVMEGSIMLARLYKRGDAIEDGIQYIRTLLGMSGR
ncbi:MAG: TetR/AcrR family transcriptional regulator [Spirochaetes bacterium]|nr:TetR/AcrR family transcriptional regulator [Spirochaetota bacterium]